MVIERKTNVVFPALGNMQHCLAFSYMAAKSCYGTIVVGGFVLHPSDQEAAKNCLQIHHCPV